MSRRARNLAALGLTGLGLASALMVARTQSLAVPTMHLDGAFQTYNGLHRLASGQWPGRGRRGAASACREV